MTPIICLLTLRFFLKYLVENFLKLICFKVNLFDPFFKLNIILFFRKISKKFKTKVFKKKYRLFLSLRPINLEYLNDVMDFFKNTRVNLCLVLVILTKGKKLNCVHISVFCFFFKKIPILEFFTKNIKLIFKLFSIY